MTTLATRLSRLLVLSTLASSALAATTNQASAQVIVYGPQPAPVVYAPPPLPTYGNLVGRTAFFGRISLGLGSDFFRVSDDVSGDSVPLLSGAALHTDFSLGLRFAFVHALTLDFDLDRGFNPSIDGTTIEDATFFGGMFGLGYTNFLRGTGLFVGAGIGLGVAWIESDDGLTTSNTGVGFTAHGRIGRDWTFGRRAHIGVSGTLRYYGLTDEDDFSWRGVGLNGAASFSWY